MKRKVAAGAVAGIALASVIGVGVAGAATGKGPAGPLAEALSGLVSNGTLTQDQADKVTEAVTEARAQARADHGERLDQRREDVDQVLQDVLGLTRDQVKQKLIDGQSVGEIVGDKGDELAAALQALVQERLDAAAQSGRLTKDQADKLAQASKSRLDAAFTPGSPLMKAEGVAGLAMLARQQFGMGLHEGMGLHGRGMGHRWGLAPDDGSPEPAESASTPATT